MTTDKLRRVKKGDRPSASQQNIIIDVIHGGPGSGPNRMEFAGKTYARDKPFPAPRKEGIHRCWHGIINDLAGTQQIFDSALEPDENPLIAGLAKDEVAVFRRNAVQVAAPSGNGPRTLYTWFYEQENIFDTPEPGPPDDTGNFFFGQIGYSSTFHAAVDAQAFCIIKDEINPQELWCEIRGGTPSALKDLGVHVQWEIFSADFVTQYLGVFGEDVSESALCIPAADSGKMRVCPTAFLSCYAWDGNSHFAEVRDIDTLADQTILSWGAIGTRKRFGNNSSIWIDDAHELRVWNDGGTGAPVDVTGFIATVFDNEIIKTDPRFTGNDP